MQRESQVSDELRRNPNLRLPDRPLVPRDIDVWEMPDGLGIQLRGGPANVVLRGTLASALAPWLLSRLDGEKTVEDVIASRPRDFCEKDVLDVLLQLHFKGLLIDGARQPDPLPSKNPLPKQLLFWERKIGATRANESASELQNKLASSRVLLVGNGYFGAAAAHILKSAGFGNLCIMAWESDEFDDSQSEFHAIEKDLDRLLDLLDKQLPGADLLITALRNFPHQISSLINRSVILHGTGWLRGEESTIGTEIGPFVDPGDSPCYTCMHLRRRSSDELPIEEKLYQDRLAAQTAEPRLTGESIAHATTSGAYLCDEAIRIITSIHSPVTLAAVVTIGFDGCLRHDSFLRIPRCNDCYRGNISQTSSGDSVSAAART